MADHGLKAISTPVRVRVLGKYLGQLGLVFSLALLAPLLVSLLYTEFEYTLRYLVLIAVLLAVCWPLSKFTVSDDLRKNEAAAITVFAFLGSAMLSVFPMQLSGLPLDDLFFESVSGVTTTGLSTISLQEERPMTFLFARAWSQWVGGLGIAVLTVALLMRQGVAARKLIHQEATENLVTTTRIHAKRVLIVYSVITVIGVVLLVLVTGDWFNSVAHVLAAVSTGGFSSFHNSLAGFDSVIPQYVLSVLSFCGALSLPLYYFAVKNGPVNLFEDKELQLLVVLCVLWISVIFMVMFLEGGYTLSTAMHHAVIMGISAKSTAGFSSIEPSQLGTASLVAMLPAMAIGGSVGSTAGGIKLLHVLILMRVLFILYKRSNAPEHAVLSYSINGRQIEEESVIRAMAVIIVYVVLIFLSWCMFIAYGYDPVRSLFEVTSAVGTVGLSAGIVTPELPALLKYVLCFDMLAGRVEVFALILVLLPGTWHAKKER